MVKRSWLETYALSTQFQPLDMLLSNVSSPAPRLFLWPFARVLWLLLGNTFGSCSLVKKMTQSSICPTHPDRTQATSGQAILRMLEDGRDYAWTLTLRSPSHSFPPSNPGFWHEKKPVVRLTEFSKRAFLPRHSSKLLHVAIRILEAPVSSIM